MSLPPVNATRFPLRLQYNEGLIFARPAMLFQSYVPPPQLLLYTETCRQWGHLIRDAVKCVARICQLAEAESRKFPADQHAGLFALAKLMWDMGDGISLLIDQGCGIPAMPLLRSLFESHLGILHIRKEDSAHRALAYQVSQIHSQIWTWQTLDPNTPVGKEFIREIAGDPLWAAVHHASVDSAQLTAALQEQLKAPAFAPIEAEWLRTRAAKRQDPLWFELFDGPSSYRRLAVATGQLGSYRILYNEWAGNIHTIDAFESLTLHPDAKMSRLPFRPLRYPLHLQETTCLAVSFLMSTADELAAEFLKDDQARSDFDRQYAEPVKTRLAKIQATPHILNIT